MQQIIDVNDYKAAEANAANKVNANQNKFSKTEQQKTFQKYFKIF